MGEYSKRLRSEYKKLYDEARAAALAGDSSALDQIRGKLLGSDRRDLERIEAQAKQGNEQHEPRDDTPRGRFRKKPVVIEAMRWSGSNLREIIDFTGLHPSANKWTWQEYEDVVAKHGLKIFSLEGPHFVSVGDWVIKGVKGEFYACKPDIFAMTYEPESAQSEITPTTTTKARGYLGSTPDGGIDDADREPAVAAPSAGTSDMQDLPALTEGEKHLAFEWLRDLALSTAPGARSAYVAIRAWSELKAAQSATQPTADADRWRTLCNLWATTIELTLTQEESGHWAIRQGEPVENEVFDALIGDTPDATIDLARAGSGRR